MVRVSFFFVKVMLNQSLVGWQADTRRCGGGGGRTVYPSASQTQYGGDSRRGERELDEFVTQWCCAGNDVNTHL